MNNEEGKDLKKAVDQLCKGGNRLPALASLAMDRNRRKVVAAWQPFETIRERLVQEHGEPKSDGGFNVLPGMKGWAAFAKEYERLALAEFKLEGELEVVSLKDIEAGFSRDDSGRRQPLDISPEELGLLVAAGMIESPSATKPKALPAAARKLKPSR